MHTSLSVCRTLQLTGLQDAKRILAWRASAVLNVAILGLCVLAQRSCNVSRSLRKLGCVSTRPTIQHIHPHSDQVPSRPTLEQLSPQLCQPHPPQQSNPHSSLVPNRPFLPLLSPQPDLLTLLVLSPLLPARVKNLLTLLLPSRPFLLVLCPHSARLSCQVLLPLLSHRLKNHLSLPPSCHRRLLHTFRLPSQPRNQRALLLPLLHTRPR